MIFVLAAGLVHADPPDMETLAREVDRAWDADVAAWADYSFTRTVLRQSFDKKGKEKFRLELVFKVTPQGDVFDEELFEIDGQKPDAGEVKEHRNAQRFTKHYQQAGELELNNPVGEDLALMDLIKDQKHRFDGEDVVDGVPCYRTRFDARKEPPGLTTREKLKYAIEGTACFSKEGYHLVLFEMETVRAVKKVGIGFNSLQMTIRGHAVGDVWLPKLVALRSDVVLLGDRMRKGNTYRYTNFRYQPGK
jgi:hypothetical protein